MQVPAYERKFYDPLYPYKWVVAEGEAANPHVNLDDLCVSNITKARMIIEKRLRTHLSCIEAVCKIALSLHSTEPEVVLGRKGLHTSIVAMQQGNEKWLFIRRKDPQALFKRKEGGLTKISKAFLFVFDRYNELLNVHGAVRFTFNVSTEPMLSETVTKAQRQLSIMQVSDTRTDLFPRNYIYLQYKLNRIVVFQERARCDLLDHHNKVQSLYLAENRFEIARRVWEAIRFLHSKEIVHRDLKLENILWFPEGVKVTDFDLSCRTEDTEACKMRPGTLRWAPPEVKVMGDTPLDFKSVDAWNLGHLFHLIVNPQPAYQDGTLSLQPFSGRILTMQDAVRVMLLQDPKQRLTVDKVPGLIFYPTTISTIERTATPAAPVVPPSEPLASEVTPRGAEPEKQKGIPPNRTHDRCCELFCTIV